MQVGHDPLITPPVTLADSLLKQALHDSSKRTSIHLYESWFLLVGHDPLITPPVTLVDSLLKQALHDSSKRTSIHLHFTRLDCCG